MDGNTQPSAERSEKVAVQEPAVVSGTHTVSAPGAGVITRIDVEPGTQVAAGEVLAVVEGEEQ